MHAIEFQTKITDGMIPIPPQYRSQMTQYATVIVFMEEEGEPVGMLDQLLQSPLRVKEFIPLKREDIYDRTI